MAKTREAVCKYYICEGSCEKGRDAHFWKYCQKCRLYESKKGKLPVRPNLKEKRKADNRNKDYKEAIREINRW